ncbi:DUF2809 domain-containing protein [Pedobacter sp. N36a]|uniref:ribosomal maturation YjgA family protein n=1 Tax=Pedobacter sp. N36a TaxID=2767996 RepID=UPI0016568E85|nr:DUF2809 domain-containing protein [Pedobacter sp. N36a]MBC8985027.1 DUF2809 domain-containing protein [Pedobacter sp. N36a]
MKLQNSNYKRRLICGLWIVIVIIAGLLSRKTTLIPAIIGDALYAVMIFLMVKFLLIHADYRKIGLISLSICFLIEFSQLYNAPWINQIRNNTFGALVLGRGFLWTDLLAYTAGTLVCLLLSQRFRK